MKQLGWALALLVVGCGNATAPMDMGGTDAKVTESCKADGQTIALGAKYGIQANLLVNVKVTPNCTGTSCIVDADADAKLLLLADVTQNGTSATVTARPCKIQIPPVALKGGNKPIILAAPQPLVESVKAVVANGTMDSTMTCAKFDAQPITIAIGANLMNPATDPLPTATMLCDGMASTRCLTMTTPAPASFGCVCDQDGDGKLGASLDAMNVPAFDDIDKVYVDLRTSVTLAGQIFPAATGQANPGPRIKGKVAALKLEQGVLGCHRAAPSGGAPRDCDAAETNSVVMLSPAVTQSVNGDSTFIAVPLAAGATCADLIAQEGSLFQ